MRLAIIRQRYTPFGGAERFLESALASLIDHGVAVSLYTREWPGGGSTPMEPTIVDPFHVGGLWRDAGFAHAVCKAIDGARIDLVQSHERLACCDVFRAGDGVHAAWLDERMRHLSSLRRLGVRINPHHRYRIAAERRMFASKRLRAVICNSKMVKEDIRARFGLSADRLHVIYNAVASDIFTPALRVHRSKVRARLRIPENATVFLQVGSGFERKGVAASIDALAQLAPPAHLIVVGKDRHLARYAQRARSHGLSRRVTLAGPQADPRPYYGAADAFVLPTLYDPCPNAALEAMACALPIITSRRSGAAELALEHEAGFVVAPGDVPALARQMQLLHEKTLRARLGANARNAVVPLTSAAMTAQLLALYRDLLDPERVSHAGPASQPRNEATG
ncbi:MAG TPA: glycosyltransferase family 4 protein [Casimicrobiaceae bacterium]|nr:glycosyltransferase family 4 protein [Casimicrobiaceae bacterium]